MTTGPEADEDADTEAMPTAAVDDHTEASGPSGDQRITVEMPRAAIDALRIISMKRTRDLESMGRRMKRRP